MRNFIFLILLALTGCAGTLDTQTADEKQPLVLKPVAYKELPGWGGSYDAALEAFRISCGRIAKRPAQERFAAFPEAGTYGDWQRACTALSRLSWSSNRAARDFFEAYFQPYAVYAGSKQEGLFPGYYEASLRGSRTQKGPYRYPLHARPQDLVMVDLGAFRDELKGQRIAGRVVDGNLKPYETREEIVTGRWPHNDKVLVWVDDPADAFFVQVQGSGVVALDTGERIRIGYAGQNGHPYYAIGRELVKRGELPKEDVSLDSIRAWMKANPSQAEALMNTNKSYVFFQELPGGDTGQSGPQGGEGVTLTPLASLAVDRSVLPYGLPLWVDIDYATDKGERLQRLMVAQDTGGAIIGPVRGDVFWGYGSAAQAKAGEMKAQGRYWALLPRR